MNTTIHIYLVRQFLMVCYVILNVTILNAQTDTVWLEKDWKVKNQDGSIEVPAHVPGYAIVDLAKAGRLPALFSPTFEEAAREACTQTWVYETTFHLDSTDLLAKELILYLESIDTYADVFINGRWAGRCGNMFTPFSFDIRPLVAKGRNSLSIQILPVTKIAAEQYDEQGDSLPEGLRVMARKAQYMFGWDWAPAIPAAGIPKKVGLLLRKRTYATIDHLNVGLSANLKNGFIRGIGTIKAEQNSTFHSEIRLDGALIQRDEYKLLSGMNAINWELVVENPEKWWPQPHGNARLYELEIAILDAEGHSILKHRRKVGFRHVSLMQKKDKKGRSFAFHINGKPIFMKGANWIPLHFFPTEATEEDYKRSLLLAKNGNVNMLRVWGGGIYERDAFYALCDSLGIMVWQDFMFACAMYPDNPGFLASVEREAAHQIGRLSSHACLALWCGNNEVAEGWSNWGWKNGRSPENISRIQEAYNLLFQKILPEKVSLLNPETPYWESSPSYGRGSKPYLTEGDAHDWYVWHDGYPFSHFLENIPRFMSEFGFQSYPSQLTMDSFAGEPAPDALIEDHWKPYQKHTRGAQIIKEYLARDFPNPSTFEEWIYLSQLMQARGISDAITAHRKAAPYCMGSLFWQWNDCWPAVSWSAFDFKAQPKAMYYFAQRAFDPLLLHLDLAGTVHLINDTLTFSPIEWSLFAVNHTGEIQKLRTDRIESASKSGKKFRLSKRENQKQWIALQYQHSGQMRTQWVVSEGLRDWRVMRDELKVNIEAVKEGLNVTITAKTPLIGCRIEHPKVKGFIQDNFIDLLPGQTFTWHLETDAIDIQQLSIMALGPPKQGYFR